MATRETTFELRNVDDLIPYARNARTHSPEQIQKLAGSIKEFGFINPIIISQDGGVLAGHGRIMAAQKLGIKQVPCVIESHLTDAQRRAYILADNRLALDAGWDEEMLKIELAELKEMDFDLDFTGFSDDELKAFLDDEIVDTTGSENDEESEPEEVNEEKESITQLGDIWLLGDHRLICGDSTDGNVVAKLFGEDNPNLMVTDPPYGVKYDPTLAGGFAKDRAGTVLNDDRASWEDTYKHFKGDVAYVWHSNIHSHTVFGDLIKCGFKITSMIIWNKPQFVIGYSDYKWKHEPCVYATRGNHNWQGEFNECTVWDIQLVRYSGEGAWGHSTQKPIECMLRPIKNNSTPGEYVYDPFLGSGTTIIAAERSGRKCLGCELSPHYCDAIVRRWQNETGRKAVLKETGAFFDDLVGDDVVE